MSEPGKKKLPIGIGSLKKQAEALEGNFAEYKEDFVRDYPVVFTDAYYSAVSGRVARANSIPSDTALRGGQVTQTAALASLVKKFDSLFARLRASVRKAYPGNKEIRLEFGLHRKSKIKRSHKTLHAFVSDLGSVWAKYGSALIAAGCAPGLVAEFEAFLVELVELSNKQGWAIDTRHTSAFERKENLFALWEDLLTFEDHAVAIFGEGSPQAAVFHVDRGPKAKANAASGARRKKKVVTAAPSTE